MIDGSGSALIDGMLSLENFSWLMFLPLLLI